MKLRDVVILCGIVSCWVGMAVMVWIVEYTDSPHIFPTRVFVIMLGALIVVSIVMGVRLWPTRGSDVRPEPVASDEPQPATRPVAVHVHMPSQDTVKLPHVRPVPVVHPATTVRGIKAPPRAKGRWPVGGPDRTEPVAVDERRGAVALATAAEPTVDVLTVFGADRPVAADELFSSEETRQAYLLGVRDGELAEFADEVKANTEVVTDEYLRGYAAGVSDQAREADRD